MHIDSNQGLQRMATMQEFKVLTLNIHKGFSMTNRRFTLEKIRQNLRETNSNIVFLQEVVGEHEKHKDRISDWPDSNQFEFLADTVWDHFAYGKNAIYQHGHHGNAILSEIPFVEFNNVDVSTLSFSQRGILHGVLENRVHLLCVHLGLFERERYQQTSRIIEYITTQISPADPLILAGDFNDWRKTSHRRLKQACGLREASEQVHDSVANTYPAMMPMLPMDRIYIRGFSATAFQVLGYSPWRMLSDHCAVVADLSLGIQ